MQLYAVYSYKKYDNLKISKILCNTDEWINRLTNHFRSCYFLCYDHLQGDCIYRTSETAEFRTQFPATPPYSYNHLANIHRNHLESTPIAQRHTTRRKNDRILPKFHRVSQKNPAHHRKLPLTTSSWSTQPFGQPDQTQILYRTQTPAQF